MSRKKKPESSGPSNAYLVSFGDTMTTLLAFFIVLNSLAQEQTGADLHAGTGSFLRAVSSLGLPGIFRKDTSANAIPREDTSPLYLDEQQEDDPPDDRSGSGSDSQDNGLRVIDREAEQFQRFVNEMEQFSNVDRVPRKSRSVTFDFFAPLNKPPQPLTEEYAQALAPIRPLLTQPEYRIEVIVWATTPSDSAWQRAANLSMAVMEQIAREGNLSNRARDRLRNFGQPWLHKNVRRPVLSIVVRKETSAD